MNLLFWYRSLMRSVGAALVKLIATATSGLVSFTTNVIRPVKVVCEFSPVQEGTGDPSPDNVRPISGWTGCNIERIGKNLLNANIIRANNRYYNSNGIDAKNTDWFLSDFIPVNPNTTYTVNINHSSTTASVRFLTANKTGSVTPAQAYSGSITTFVTPSDCYYVSLSVYKDTASTTQMELGPVATDYEEYHATTLPINWESEAGTIYGGTVTLNEDGSVDLVVTRGLKPISDWRYYTIRKQNPVSGWDSFQLYLPATDIKQEGGAIVDGKPNVWSTIFQARSNAEIAQYPDYSMRKGSGYVYLAVPENAYANWNEFKTALADVPIVYPLATPLTYHFDNIGQLRSFLGTNNIWHNMNGDITVEYWNKQ